MLLTTTDASGDLTHGLDTSTPDLTFPEPEMIHTAPTATINPSVTAATVPTPLPTPAWAYEDFASTEPTLDLAEIRRDAITLILCMIGAVLLVVALATFFSFQGLC